jgi:acetolactate synthase-1/2/3 large subunit
MKGYEFLATLIRYAGLDAVFFVPTFLYPTLVELASDKRVRCVLCHDEKAAAYMADGYAQAAGRPGLVIAQGGPGAVNLSAGLADAWQSHTPVLALTPAMPHSRYHSDAYQEVYPDFRSVTKFDAEVRTIERMPEFFSKAYRSLTTGAPRPVHLYLDGSLEEAEAVFDFRFFDERFFSYPAFRPRADEGLVTQAVRELVQARRPMMVCGRGAVASAAWAEVTALAERLGVPVATTLGGKGSIDERHPLSMGVVGSYRRPSTDCLIAKADLVLFVGCHPSGAVTHLQQRPRPGIRLIHIDIDPARPGANYPNVLPLIGDARTVLRQMLEAIESTERSSGHDEWLSVMRREREIWREQERDRLRSSAIPIRPERLMAEIARHCPTETLYVTDTGYAGTWAGVYLDLPAGRNFLHCEGSLGWAFPAALGAKAAVGQRPVVAIIGDGGFFYHLAELETAVRVGLPVLTVVLDNHAMAYQTHYLESRWGGRHGLNALSRFGETRFDELARAMGGWGRRVTDPDDIPRAVYQALESGVPAVLDILIDPTAAAPVAFAAGQASREKMLALNAPVRS